METLEQKLAQLKNLAAQMCELIDGIDGRVKVSFIPKEDRFQFANNGGIESTHRGSLIAISVEVVTNSVRIGDGS